MDNKRVGRVALGITVLVAGGLTGCGRTAERDAAGYCVDKQTQERVPDSECRNHRSHAGWYYVRNGTRFPGIGGRASGGGFTAPKGTSYVDGGLSEKGGVANAGSVKGGTAHNVTKGGFGGLGGKSGS